MTLIGRSSERRRWPRVPIQINVKVGFGVEVLTVANLRDISTGGAHIELQGPLNPAFEVSADQNVLVRFLLPGTTTEVEVAGRVARLIREAENGPVVGLGVEFLKVRTEFREIIEAYIASQVGAGKAEGE